MTQYWVVGGEYTDTDFKEFAPGKKEVRKGPFDTYEEATKAWGSLAWATVDECLSHYHITEDSEPSEAQYWVVGGTYESTNFENPTGEIERFGPFKTYEEAETEWQSHAWRTVDDATAWYRIETRGTAQEQEEIIDPNPNNMAYRLLTGTDDDAFCIRVSDAVKAGWELYGNPTISVSGDRVVTAQAVIWPEFYEEE